MLIPEIELDSKRSRDPIPLECLYCGKTHFRTKNTIQRILHGQLKNTNKGCFCSNECKNKNRSTLIYLYCRECNKKISERGKNINNQLSFCNRSCSATFFNKQRRKIQRTLYGNCIFCKNPFPIHSSYRKQRYCSAACHSHNTKHQTFERIEKGEILSHKQFRDYLIFKHDAKCMECGWNKINPKTKKCPIQLEHIDGNYENNTLSNLKLLCPNCHSLTITFGSLNRGSGRYFRRLRYAAGKSS